VDGVAAFVEEAIQSGHGRIPGIMMGCRGCLDAFDDAGSLPVEDFLEEGLLAGEVMIDGAPGDQVCGGDAVE
jgi:hypothetical protein